MHVGAIINQAKGLAAKGLWITSRWALFLFVGLVCATHAAKATGFQFVETTGRAVITDTANTDLARRLALEDALYLAALEGGVDVSGFQASLNDQLVSDELVLRPSSSILNYHIIQEAAEGSHYQVRIKAAVGALPKRNCQHRPISHATLFAPTIQFEGKLPALLKTQMPRLVNQLAAYLDADNRLSLRLAINTDYVPADNFALSAAFDYAALTEGRKDIAAGEFAIVPEMHLQQLPSGSGLFKKQRVALNVRLHIFEAGSASADVVTSDTVTMGLKTDGPLRSLSILSEAKREALIEQLISLVEPLSKKTVRAINCQPLTAKLQLDDGALTIDIGQRQGLREDAMAVLSDSMMAVQFLTISQLEAGRARLTPLNPNADLESLNGKRIAFMEFKK